MKCNKWLALLAGSLLVLVSCSNPAVRDNMNDTLSFSEAMVIDTGASSCAYLTKDEKGDPVIGWVRMLNDSSSVACYAISRDNGKTFGKPVEVPASRNLHAHAENMPKLVFKPSGEIISIWGAANPRPENLYYGQVFYAQSFDAGKTWTTARRLVSDTSSHDQRYFDVALLPDGEAAVIWLDSRKTSGNGSAIFFAATRGRSGFQDERRIGKSCCECCRTDLFIDSKTNIHVAYRAIINDSIRDMVHSVSVDGGRTFSTPQRLHEDNWLIKGCPHTGPVMAEGNSGMQFSWYTMGSGGGIYSCSSSDLGRSFSERDSVRARTSARHPQMAALKGDDMMVVWDETIQENNRPVTKIGVQKRSPSGLPPLTRYVTPDTVKSTYPVICRIDTHTGLIAYNENRNEKSRVVLKKIFF